MQTPPPPPFPPTPPIPAYNNQQQLTGEQWEAMWKTRVTGQGGTDVNTNRHGYGSWEDAERARSMRARMSGSAWDSGNKNRRGQSGTNMNVEMHGHGNTENAWQENDSCENRPKQQRKRKDRSNSRSRVTDSDYKSHPDSESSDGGESVESVPSSEEEREESMGGVNEKEKDKAHIPGAYFGTHSLYDSARVIDITGKVVAAQKAINPTEKGAGVFTVQAQDKGVALSEEEHLEKSEVTTLTSHTQNVPIEESTTTTTTYEVSPKPIDKPGAQSEAVLEGGPSVKATEPMTSTVMHENKGATDQSQDEIQKQIDLANTRAAARENSQRGLVASETEGEKQVQGQAKKKQTTLTRAGQLLKSVATEESEISDGGKSKEGKKGSKKKKGKNNDSKTKEKEKERENRPAVKDKSEDAQSRKTRSQSQSQSQSQTG